MGVHIMGRSKLFSLLQSTLVVGFLLTALLSSANASHFRHGQLSWKRITGQTVEFTFDTTWRSTFLDNMSINPGDGSSNITGTPVNLGTFTDIAGESYTRRRVTVQHTYSSDGPFTAFARSCCRIGSLKNAANAAMRVEAVVDLQNGNSGSPVSSTPPIIQMAQGQTNSIAIPIADPDGDPITCRMATSGESSIPAVASSGGNMLSVSNSCVLNWDLSTAPTVAGDKYAVQVMIPENRTGCQVPNGAAAASTAACSGRTPLDFIIEIVVGNSPVCSSSQQGVTNLSVGQAFSAQLTGTDADGDDLELRALNLPAGFVLNPPDGTVQPQPMNATVTYTPTAADMGNPFAFNILFVDPTALQGQCAFSGRVLSNTIPTCDIGGPYTGLTAQPGATTEIKLDGSGSSDPDGDTLTYAWTTTCAGASFDDPSSATPILTVPNQDSGVQCEVGLEVNDGTVAVQCSSAMVEIQPENLDCAGVPNGKAVLDACGECGGGNSSCKCERVDLSSFTIQMDGNGNGLGSLVARASKIAFGMSRKGKTRRRFGRNSRNSEMQEANNRDTRIWELSQATLAQENISNCGANVQCASITTTGVTDEIASNTKALLMQIMRIARRTGLRGDRRMRKIIRHAADLRDNQNVLIEGYPASVAGTCTAANNVQVLF